MGLVPGTGEEGLASSRGCRSCPVLPELPNPLQPHECAQEQLRLASPLEHGPGGAGGTGKPWRGEAGVVLRGWGLWDAPSGSGSAGLA